MEKRTVVNYEKIFKDLKKNACERCVQIKT